MNYLVVETKYTRDDLGCIKDYTSLIIHYLVDGVPQSESISFKCNPEFIHQYGNKSLLKNFYKHISKDTYIICDNIESHNGPMIVNLFNDCGYTNKDILDLNWIDLYLISKMILTTSNMKKKDNIDFDSNIRPELTIDYLSQHYLNRPIENVYNDYVAIYKQLLAEYIQLTTNGRKANYPHEHLVSIESWEKYFNKRYTLSRTEYENKLVWVSNKAIVYSMINRNGLPVDGKLINYLNKNKKELRRYIVQHHKLSSYFVHNSISKQIISDCESQIKELGLYDIWPRNKDNSLSFDGDKAIDGVELSIYLKNKPDLLVTRYVQCFNDLKNINRISDIASRLKDNVVYYGQHNVFDAKTGRCNGQPTLGYIPGTCRQYKRLYKAPPGKVLFSIDLSAAEIGIAAYLCCCNKLKDAYNEKDLYLYAGTMVPKESELYIPIDDYKSLSLSELKSKYKFKRDRLKTIIIGISYGRQPYSIAKELGVSELEAAKMMSQFQYTKLYKQPNPIMKEVCLYQTLFYSNPELKFSNFDNQTFKELFGTPTCLEFKEGYILRLDDNVKVNSTHNWPFQGGCAMILFSTIEELVKRNITIHYTLHDSIVCSCDVDKQSEVQNDIQRIINESAKKVLCNNNCRMKMDIEWAIKNKEFVEPNVDRPSFIDLYLNK